MARSTFTIDGISGLQAALDKFGAALKREVSKANETTAHAIAARARQHAPADKGDLRRAIQVAGRGLSWRVGLSGEQVSSRRGSSSHQHPHVYGRWYEYGFVTRRIHAAPFMRPAVEAETPAHQERLQQAVADAVSQAR